MVSLLADRQIATPFCLADNTSRAHGDNGKTVRNDESSVTARDEAVPPAGLTFRHRERKRSDLPAGRQADCHTVLPDEQHFLRSRR